MFNLHRLTFVEAVCNTKESFDGASSWTRTAMRAAACGTPAWWRANTARRENSDDHTCATAAGLAPYYSDTFACAGSSTLQRNESSEVYR